ISVQCTEIETVILAFQMFQDQPVNLTVDIQYVLNLLIHLPHAYLPPPLDVSLLSLFLTLKNLLNNCMHLFFAAHIHSHTGFNGTGSVWIPPCCVQAYRGNNELASRLLRPDSRVQCGNCPGSTDPDDHVQMQMACPP
ncbi:hypothetical protein JRQ81_018983, partial [Phrynocephalus forsythii]